MASLTLPTVHLHDAVFTVVPPFWWPHLKGPAVYAFGHREIDSAVVLYVGQTGDMAGYFGPSHPKRARAVARRMTDILVHLEPEKQRRFDLETHLRRVLPATAQRSISPRV